MFRQASRLLARTTVSSRSRAFSSDVPATPAQDSNFIESWTKVIPNLDPPKTPSSFMTPRPATPSSIPSKLTVNFVLPYASELSGKEFQTWIWEANGRLQKPDFLAVLKWPFGEENWRMNWLFRAKRELFGLLLLVNRRFSPQQQKQRSLIL